MNTGIQKITILVRGTKRRCLIFVPTFYSENIPLPLVLMFHGAGATARWTLEETRLEEKAEEAGFLLAIPEALPPEPKKIADFWKNPPLWNNRKEENLDLIFIEQLLEELPEKLPMQKEQVFVAGFSNGASFTYLLAESFSHRIAAIAPVAGPCLFAEPKLEEAVNTLFIMGTEDPLLPLNGGKIQSPWGSEIDRPSFPHNWEDWVKALGCSKRERIRQEGYSIYKYQSETGVIMESYLIENHGHHWPGGRGKLNESIGGKNNSTLQANDLLWDFFQRSSPISG